MSTDELLKCIKSGNANIPAFEIVVTAGENEMKGSGLIEISPGHFRLKFTCIEGAPPELPTLIPREKFWRIAGRFASGMSFNARHVPPPSSWRGWDFPKTCSFNLESIEVEATGFDNLNYDEFEELLRNPARQAEDSEEKVACFDRGISRHSGIYHLVIPEYVLLFGNEEIIEITHHPFLGETTRGIGRVLRGDTDIYDYCLSQNNGDLGIDIKSKKGQVTSEEQDQRFLEALLQTISFTHGQEIRPFHFQYWRDHKLIEHRFKPIKIGVQSSNIPFPERLCLEGAFRKVAFDFIATFGLILKFFLSSDIAISELADYLAELRFTSVKGMNPSHSRLAVCRVFEGVVDLLFDELQLEKSMKSAQDVVLFEAARSRISRWIHENGGPGSERLSAIVSSANAMTTNQKYVAIAKHFGFNLSGIAREILDDWKRRRHPLAHGRFDGRENNAAALEAWAAQSRIVGGTIMLILKFSGYSGPMRLSSIENTYINIP